MPDFVRAAATAKRLVEASGRQVWLVKSNREAADEAKPWRGPSSNPHPSLEGAQFPVTMAFVPAEGGGFGKLVADIAGTVTTAFEQVGLLASDSLPAGVTPETVEQADRVRDGSDVWRVVTRGHLRPASKSILFVLGLVR